MEYLEKFAVRHSKNMNECLGLVHCVHCYWRFFQSIVVFMRIILFISQWIETRGKYISPTLVLTIYSLVIVRWTFAVKCMTAWPMVDIHVFGSCLQEDVIMWFTMFVSFSTFICELLITSAHVYVCTWSERETDMCEYSFLTSNVTAINREVLYYNIQRG